MRAILFALGFVGFAGVAHADPCEAPIPANGTQFSGTVRYIVDGDGFCVGETSNPAEWVEVRVANFFAPELKTPEGAKAKQTMRKLAYGRSATCVAGRKSWDRTIAVCEVGGADIGDQMRDAGVSEGGNR